MTIPSEIKDLASHIAREAAREDDECPSFQEKVDALDKLTRYLVAESKYGSGEGQDADEASFDRFAEELKTVSTNEEPNGKTTIRGRRGITGL